MSTSSEAADQVVRITLDGVQTAVRISGDAALEIAKLLIQELHSPQQTKGRASLKTMLKSQKPIKVFSIEDKNLKRFCEEAKKYGVLYHIIKDKNTDRSEIMVRAEDAAKVNRIYERLHLSAHIDKDKTREKIIKAQQDDIPEPNRTVDEKFVDILFEKPLNKETSENENPTMAKTKESRPSEPSSNRTTRDTRYISMRENRDPSDLSVHDKIKKYNKERIEKVQSKTASAITDVAKNIKGRSGKDAGTR